MTDTCGNCQFYDKYRFCEKLVVSTIRTKVENDKYIKAYYIDLRGEDDERSSFVTPPFFKCGFHEPVTKERETV